MSEINKRVDTRELARRWDSWVVAASKQKLKADQGSFVDEEKHLELMRRFASHKNLTQTGIVESFKILPKFRF